MTEPTTPAGDDGQPLTVSQVLAHYDWPEADRPALAGVVGAVNVFVRRACRLPVGADGDVYADGDVTLGAIMFAGKLWRRRGTPGGIESFDGTPAFVRRHDPDVAMLLRLGRPVAR